MSVQDKQFVTEDQNTVIVYASDEMILEFGKNPTTIFIDGTHGTNQSRFVLVSILVSDSRGEGMPIMEVIAEGESTSCLVPAFQILKELAPDAMKHTKVMCPPSNVCAHTYICSCPTYAREGNCKHIHLTAILKIFPTPPTEHVHGDYPRAIRLDHCDDEDPPTEHVYDGSPDEIATDDCDEEEKMEIEVLSRTYFPGDNVENDSFMKLGTNGSASERTEEKEFLDQVGNSLAQIGQGLSNPLLSLEKRRKTLKSAATRAAEAAIECPLAFAGEQVNTRFKNFNSQTEKIMEKLKVAMNLDAPENQAAWAGKESEILADTTSWSLITSLSCSCL
ncbi:hypothetical protein TCAL_16802 [Tigriopus californicus]|uniref:SWIM-type domain-containing protein n=1 Tax=Tigriopus californicus TaxID=6832 RepID=A0A553PBI5_TIGCA|nr:hypothetical protein TCAL_16802 [Tigriopus californicus]